ncbi:MAG: WS/DGAT domain-containing protein [Candidatus Binatia bacterium]|nr:WS/DGAT domain-containing protein [Candidatus Binatia bacterium]
MTVQALTNLERLFFALDKPTSPAQLAWLCVLAGRLSLPRLKAYIAERLGAIPHARERLSSRRPLGRPQWEEDQQFSLQNHVRLTTIRGAQIEHALAAYSRLLQSPWNYERPLWEVHLLQPPRSGPSSILLRVHRGILPWANEAAFVNAVLAPQPSPPPPEAPPVNQQVEGTAGGLPLLSVLPRLIRNPLAAAEDIRLFLDSSLNALRTWLTPAPAIPRLNGPLTGRTTFDLITCPAHEIRQIRGRVGGSALEIILSCIIGGIAAVLHKQVALPDDAYLSVCVPLTSGSEQDAQRTGTRTTLGVARLPLNVSDPVERLRRVSAELDLLRALQVPEQFRQMLALIRELPPAVFDVLSSVLPKAAPVNAICLELPGLRERRYIAGKEVAHVVSMAPLALDVRVVIAVQSYATELSACVSVDQETGLQAGEIAAEARKALNDLTESALLIKKTG